MTDRTLAERAWRLQADVHALRIAAEHRVASPLPAGYRTDEQVRAVEALHRSDEWKVISALWELCGLVVELAGGVARAPAGDRAGRETP